MNYFVGLRTIKDHPYKGAEVELLMKYMCVCLFVFGLFLIDIYCLSLRCQKTAIMTSLVLTVGNTLTR